MADRDIRGRRVRVMRGRHRGHMATVEGTDTLGRVILRVDGVFAPVFLSATSVRGAQ